MGLWKIEQTDNVFMLINENGAVFDNNQGKGHGGNPELSGERTNKDNQKWDLVKINNKCFDDTGRKEINRLYHLWDCNDSNRNQWFEFVEPEIIIKKVNYPKGWLHIVGPTGLCVSLINDNKADRLSQQKCDMLDDLLWKIEEIKKENNNEDIRLVNKAGRVIGNESNKGNNGNPIVGEGVGKNLKNQIWKIELLSNGRIQIVDSVHKKCFD